MAVMDVAEGDSVASVDVIPAETLEEGDQDDAETEDEAEVEAED